MKRSNPLRLIAAVSMGLALAAPTMAHRAWLMPGSTVLSGAEPWVTIDAGISTDPFVLDHQSIKLDDLVVVGPDGAAVTPENKFQGKLRSVFDLKLAQKGTYKIALVSKGVMASYTLNGESKRFRGTEETLAKEVPANAENLSITRSLSRNETFVTSGKPNDKALAPTGEGLELVPVTHPNDLFAGDEAKFRFVVDGKPAAGLSVSVIPGGTRYRQSSGEQRLVTDAQGQVSIKWATAGLYYFSASIGGERPPGAPQGAGGPGTGSGASAPAPRPAPPVGGPPQRRVSYAATFEVLPQ